MLILLLACFPKPEVELGAMEPLPLVRTSNDRRWFVPVDVNGEQWVWFLDTGYAATTCDDDLLEELEVPTRGRAVVRGENGRLTAERADLPRFELGGHTIGGLQCVVRDLDRTSSIRDPREVNVAGVLGMDVLGHFQVQLDPELAELRLHPPGTLEVEGARLRRVFWDPRVRVAVDIGGKRVWPYLDTGTSSVYLDGARLALEPVGTRKNVVMRGTGHREEIRDIHQYREDIRFADVPLEQVVVNGRARGNGAEGLVGLSVVKRFVSTWDFPNGRVQLAPASADQVRRWSEWRAASRPPRSSGFTAASDAVPAPAPDRTPPDEASAPPPSPALPGDRSPPG